MIGLWRASAGREGGFTVTELAVALMMAMVVGAVFGSTLVSSTQAASTLKAESEAIDRLRVAMTQIEREFRSGECVAEPNGPASGVPTSGPRLRFTTHANGGLAEVTYEVSGGRLLRTEGTETAVIGDHLAGGGVFTYVETPRRSVDLVFTVAVDGREERTLETTIAGRNAWRAC